MSGKINLRGNTRIIILISIVVAAGIILAIVLSGNKNDPICIWGRIDRAYGDKRQWMLLVYIRMGLS